MIEESELERGACFKTDTPHGNMHNEFAIWNSSNCQSYWIRVVDGYGVTGGMMGSIKLLKFLNRHKFRRVGIYKKSSMDYVSEPLDTFEIGGGL